MSPAAPRASANIASHLAVMAARDPSRKAIISPTGESLCFSELNARSDMYARGLEAIGIGRGVRTVLMAQPGLEFFPLVFGLFKAGAVPVMIDPGIGRARLLSCLDEIEAEAFIGVPRAHVARLLFPRHFRKVRALVTVGSKWFWGGHSLRDLERLGAGEPHCMMEPAPGEVAAILFTSGSTGIPKGVVYTHEMFDAQVRMIRATYGIEPGEIDLPTFPLFALFDPALGMTAVLPPMDFRFPSEADPKRLIEAITKHACTNMFASPALLDALGRYGEAHGTALLTLCRILCAGAPVRTDVLVRMTKLLAPGAQVFTPFGATEALPVASIGSDEVLRETAAGAAEGKGLCVGRPVEGAVVRIIGISDDPIVTWDDALEVPTGTMGEITVKGAMVTREYHARPEMTALAKIREGEDVVHRMGDVGYFDERGRLWMCGRKGQRVRTASGTLFTVPVEEIFNAHPEVRRSALVGAGDEPVVILERERGALIADDELLREVAALGAKHDMTRCVTRFLVYPHAFPVDARHQAKIEREKLALWAKKRLR